MKWIGQHIYDLISRFRGDVYLENISSGTIASGGNLGLDSNNKIVKATDSAPDADDSTKGIVELATTAETTTGTDATRAVTPDGLKDGYQGSTNVTTLGTISAGAWQGDAIASAYLDADTAHLSGSQSFTGTKSFLANTTNFFNDQADCPQIFVENAHSGTSAGKIVFVKDKGAAGADGDDCGSIFFMGDNSAQELTSFSKIIGEVGTAADTDEAGKLSFQVAASDGSTSSLRDTIVLTGHGTNNIVDASIGYGATSTTTVNGDLTVSGDTVTFESANANDPTVVIKNNTNDNQGARLQIKKSRVTGGGAQASGDNIAEIDFFGENDADAQRQYGKILMKTDVVAEGEESGDMRLQVATHDASLTQGLKLIGGANTSIVDATIGNGADSVTTVAGTLTMGSTAALTNAGLVAVAAQTNITSLGTLTALTVDDIALNTKSITITGDTNDTFDITTGAAGATTLTTVDTAGTAGHFEVAADGDITLDSAAAINFEATGDITATTDNFYITSANSTDPNFQLTNTTNDATGPRFRFLNNRGADGVDNDETGRIEFWSYDDGTPSGEQYATIVGTIHDATTTEESGKLELQVASHDGGSETGLSLVGGSVDTEVDVTIGNGTSSVTTIAGDLNIAATGAVFRAGIPNIYGSVIKLIPSDFMANDDGGNTKFGVGYVESAGALYGMRTANNATELFAFVSIPEGMKATHVDIFDKNDLAVEVFEAQINATTMTSLGSGNANTTINITDVNSTAQNFLAIQVTTTSATNDKVYGGQVTIAIAD